MTRTRIYWGLVGLALSWVSPAFAETSVWLVRPLYPGQEALVEKTERALDKLMPGDARKDAIIGQKELAAALKARKVDDVPCFTGDTRCADPIDPFVAGLGFDRVVLLQGGQDEAGFKYRVVAYEPKVGKVTPATATNAVLEKALLGAVAKVVPVSSTLEVKSVPGGATVFVDDVKVGVTPLSTPVLPGERVVRLDLKLHQPIEETVIVPIRGVATVARQLEKVAARIVITASPPGAAIAIDGQVLGRDKIDRGILPGTHTVRITADNHKASEETITVKADDTISLDRPLQPIPGTGVVTKDGVKSGVDTVKIAPPPPKTDTELTYDKKSYFLVGGQIDNLTGGNLVGRRWGNDGTGRTETIQTPGRTLMGGTLEYGNFGKYFGLTVVGVSYVTNTSNFGMSVGWGKGDAQETKDGVLGPLSLDPVRIHLVTIRAIQPQFRLCVWKFMFSLQAGLEFRTGQIIGTGDTFYKDGFMPLDLMGSARFNARMVLGEFFFYGSANYTLYLTGETTNNDIRSSGSWGANVGVGYGF